MEYKELSDFKTRDKVYAQLSWKDIYVEFPASKKSDSKTIVLNSKGYVRPSEFLVIMGPSGAGKTTLLNVLSQKNMGKLKITSGVVQLNNIDIDKINYKNTLGFVPQDDIVLEVLTPRETLQFSADLTLNIPRQERQKKVEKLLEDLGILSCADTKIGGRFLRGISGGEKKRTSIGVELISDPPILFLDEPTTGLDSFTAESIIKLIDRQAKEYNRTIISTIHQPNSQIFNLFDRLLLLSKGKTVYFGRAEKAARHFEGLGFPVPKNFNPADHYMTVLSKENLDSSNLDTRVSMMHTSFHQTFESEANQEHMPIPEPYSKAPLLQKWGTLVNRSILTTVRNPLVIKAKLAKIVIQGAFIIAAFYDLSTSTDQLRDRDGALFLLLGISIFEAMSSNITSSNSYTVQLHKPLFYREYSCRKYGVLPFFLTINLVDAPFDLIFVIGFISISYWPLGLNDHTENFFLCMMVLLLCALVGASYGLLISAIAPNLLASLSLSPVFYM
jgi:ABC-type multidrug transport system ATPase subunit